MIYLDYAANTPADERVLAKFCETERAFFGNANSSHAAGKSAKEKLESITASIAEKLGVLPEEIIYTSGASEANNLAIKGIAAASRHVGRHIISTPLEHASVSGALTALQEKGYEIDLVDITRDGTVDLEHLRELLRKDTVLVAVTAVDSELGTVQPVHEIAGIIKEYPQCVLHVDGTQMIGKTEISPLCAADMFSFAPHKFYGLNGCGILVKKKGIVLEPLIHGGVSTTIYRSGTPALALAAATDTALTFALSEQEERKQVVKQHRETLCRAFAKYEKVRVNSPAGAVPHILNISVQGIKGSDFQKALSDCEICVSVKSACSAPGTPSRAVFAVSRDRKNAMSSFRISLSHLTTEKEIEEFLSVFDRLYKKGVFA